MELLVVVAVIAVLLAIMVPALAGARKTSRRTVCASNLHSVGGAMQRYLSSEGAFPSVHAPPKVASMGKWSKLGPVMVQDGTDPIADLYVNHGTVSAPSYASMGDPLANLWVLVLQGTPPKLFVCPSDGKTAGPANILTPSEYLPDHGTFENFGLGTSSYSFAYPWISPTGPVAAWWRGTADSSTVLGADIGPSLSKPDDDPTAFPGNIKGNSKNHDGLGQNVLFGDAHVEFCKKNNVGPGNDNIYTGDHNSISVKNGGAQFTTSTNLNVDIHDGVLAPARP